MRLLVTGSRYATEKHRPAIEKALWEWWDGKGRPRDAVLVHGDARGVDRIAKSIWQAQGFPFEDHPADWDKYRKAAGFIRNQEMVDLGADDCIAFPLSGEKNSGTFDCLDRAQAADILTRTVWLEP